MPTTLGFISDVHADVHALRDALRLLDAMDVREIVCLGDVLDYGIFPDDLGPARRAVDSDAAREPRQVVPGRSAARAMRSASTRSIAGTRGRRDGSARSTPARTSTSA